MKVILLLATALPFIVCQVITGGQHSFDAELTDPNVVFAVNEINNFFKTNGDNRLRAAEKVVSATSQVVAGVIYRFNIEVSGGDSKELCSVAVWSRPWLLDADKTILQGTPTCIAEVQIQPVGGLPGGQQNASLSDVDVQKAVSFLEKELNARSNSLFYLKATGASKVTKQVVNGIIYRFFDLKFATSDCTQNEGRLATKVCLVSADALTLETCTSVVYYNPREAQEYKIDSENCAHW